MNHGTSGGYSAHKKAGEQPCEACAAAYAKWSKHWRLDNARGIARLIDATGVQAHIAQLRGLGMSRGSIASAAGISRTTLHNVEHNRLVQTSTARKILAVRGPVWSPADAADETFVPRLGAARRIEALLALGWTHAHMRASSGVNTAVVLHQEGEWITVRNHARIAAMYDDLSMTPGPSARTRGRAAKLGYAPPLAWDEGEIDKPNARAKGHDNRKHGGKHVSVGAVVELRDMGLTAPQIADRLGCCRETVFRRLKDAA